MSELPPTDDISFATSELSAPPCATIGCNHERTEGSIFCAVCSDLPPEPSIHRKRLKGFRSKCERLGFWPGKVQEWYDARRVQLRKQKLPGDNHACRDAERRAYDEVKLKFGQEVLTLIAEIELEEKAPQAVYRRQLRKLIPGVAAGLEVSTPELAKWVGDHLSIEPGEIDLSGVPCRMALEYLIDFGGPDNGRRREFLKDIYPKLKNTKLAQVKEEGNGSDEYDPLLDLIDELEQAAEPDRAEESAGEPPVPSEVAAEGGG